MNEFLALEFKNLDAVGLGVACCHRGEMFNYSFGKANLDYDIDVSETSVFNIASIGKLLTAVAVFQLIERGELSLETELKSILEDLPNSYQPVQIEHLLTHTSGIKSYTSVDEYWKETRLDVTRERIFEYIKDYDLDFEPGAAWSYNNSGFYLLGFVIEKISGQSYFDYVRDNILTPLKLEKIYPTNAYVVMPERAAGHEKFGDSVRPTGYYSNAGLFSAGGFSAKLSDFLLFEKAVFEARIINANSLSSLLTEYRLNSGKTVKEAFPKYNFEMCHGIYRFFHSGKTVYAHNGGVVGFSSAYMRVCEDDFSIIAATNTQDRSEIDNFLFRFYDEWTLAK